MKILRIARSGEECQQAGWIGLDIFFDQTVTEEQVLLWESLGDLVYLPQLRQPFYRIASQNFLIKGLVGMEYLRIGLLRGSMPTDIDAMTAFFRLLSDNG